MARQTLLSFLGAGKVKKTENGKEKEIEIGKGDNPLNMADVEEDIFNDIPERGKTEEEKIGTMQSVFKNWKESRQQAKPGQEELKQGEPELDEFSEPQWWIPESSESLKEDRKAGTEGSWNKEEENIEAKKLGTGNENENQGKEKQPDQDIIEPEYEVEKAKSIYFEIVLDKTVSMAKVYRRVYKKLEKMIDNMDRTVKNYQKKGQVGLKWGLTLITDAEPETVKFNDSCFTASPDRIKKALKEFQFEGGSENGRENINEALTAAIKALSEESQGEGRCGLILLTDSLPEEEDMEPDFEYLENVKHTELCFAHCFVYNCETYTPYFNMVDGEGETDVKGIHYLEVRDLDAYLNREADNLTEKLLKKILHQTSVSV